MEAGAVHTWLVPVEMSERAAERCARLLSPEERARAERYKAPGRAAQFIAGRAALREILGRVLGVDPAELRFTQNERGKPALAGAGPSAFFESPVHFNVAHSGAFALIAVTRVGPVGVDLEAVRPVSRRAAAASRWLSDEDLALLKKAAEKGAAGPDEAFLRLWTRKEALVKAWGAGMAWSDARRISVGQDRVAATGGAWTIRSWTPRPGYVAAACAPGDSWRLACGEWELSCATNRRPG